MRRFWCAITALLLIVTALSSFPAAAGSSVEGKDLSEEGKDFIQDGLFAWFRGDQNTPDGQDIASTVWQDLVSGHEISVNRDDNNYFTEEGLRVNGEKHYFNEDVLNLVNDSFFTIEIEFGEFSPIGQDYNVFMNSSNDYFSLFRRVSEDVIEWKFGGGNTRPKIPQSLNYLGGHWLTFTCEYGEAVVMYVDGVEMARAHCDLYMGADDLFIGQTEQSRSYDALYKNIRFYSRPLTAEEVAQNARVAGYDPEDWEKRAYSITVAQPVTNIVGDVAAVRPIGSKEEFDEMVAGDVLPATAIYEINSKLEVLGEGGTPFSTVEKVMEESQYSILPCFVISDRMEANALAVYLDRISFYDVQIMSADKEVLKYAREWLPRCYGILDLRREYADVTDLSKEQLLDIRRAVKTYNASVAVLPVALCRGEDVQYLYERQVNVWAWGSEHPDKTEAYYALLSGAVGVVTDDTDLYLHLACNGLASNTLTRVSTNVGHRGMPSEAPENTLEGSILAYEHGANVIEMDVYLTTDGHVVAMHDGTTGRTCNENLVVEDSTLAALKELYANKSYEDDPVYSKCRIPTLEEYFQWFKGKDCLFFIEIKSSKPAIVSAIKQLIEQYDIYDQCSVITFNESIMETMRAVYPEMSVGALSGGLMTGGSSDEDMRNVMSFIGPYNGTHNPDFSGYDGEDLRACMIRGISVYPWTITGNEETLAQYFLWGYGGLTNNHGYLLADVVRKVTPADLRTLDLYRSVEIQHTVTTFKGDTGERPVSSVILLEGEATVSRYSIKPLKTGEITYMTATSFDLMGTGTYVMYTQPTTVSVVDPLAEEETDAPVETTAPAETVSPADPETDESTPVSEDTDKESTADPKPVQKGCGSVVSGLTCMVIVSAAAVLWVTATRRRAFRS